MPSIDVERSDGDWSYGPTDVPGFKPEEEAEHKKVTITPKAA